METDLDLLQGEWRVTALEVDGGAVAFEGARIVVRGNRFEALGMGSDYDGRLVLDPLNAPKRFSLHFDVGVESGNVNHGIYDLNGAVWRICLATRGDAAPRSFATAPGTGYALEVLERAGAAGKKKALASRVPLPSGPATELEGEWRMVSCCRDGEPLPADFVACGRRVFRGDRTTLYFGKQVFSESGFSIAPGQIEYGPQHGIYVLSGDELRTAVGVERPADYTPGKGRTVAVWRRG